jgi:hypothetical protein
MITQYWNSKMIEWLAENWEWCLLGFYSLEKAVKLSPSTKDDIIFDAVIKPIWQQIVSMVKK